MSVGRSEETVKQVSVEEMQVSMEKMNGDIMEKLRQKIVQHKDDLWWYWMQVDEKGTGKVRESL